MNLKSLRYVNGFFLIGIVGVILAPYFFTRAGGYIDFTATGEIGDTIGGITAPIASLLGSFLVYFALRAQIDANMLIQNQVDSQQKDEADRKTQQFLLDQLKVIREDILEFEHLENAGGGFISRAQIGGPPPSYVTYKGAQAFYRTIASFKDANAKIVLTPKYAEIKTILTAIKDLILQVNNSKLDEVEKNNIKTLILYLVESKINSAFVANTNHKARRTKDGTKEGIPEELFSLHSAIQSGLKSDIHE
jgi:hypothetical protein